MSDKIIIRDNSQQLSSYLTPVLCLTEAELCPYLPSGLASTMPTSAHTSVMLAKAQQANMLETAPTRHTLPNIPEETSQPLCPLLLRLIHPLLLRLIIIIIIIQHTSSGVRGGRM